MAERDEKKRGRSPILALVAVLAIAAGAVLAVSIFFRVGSGVAADGERVSNITVAGNAYYTAEEIIEASGIEGGDNLLFINRGAAASRIYSRLPYVESADVSLQLPNRVTITVTESRAVAYVTAEDGYWAIDRTGKLLAQPGAGELSGLIRVEGLAPVSPAVGQKMEAALEDASKLGYLTAILGHLTELGLLDNVAKIDMSNVSNPALDYLGRFTVRLGAYGTGEDLDYKFRLLLSALEKLQEGDRGVLEIDADHAAVHLTRQ